MSWQDENRDWLDKLQAVAWSLWPWMVGLILVEVYVLVGLINQWGAP